MSGPSNGEVQGTLSEKASPRATEEYLRQNKPWKAAFIAERLPTLRTPPAKPSVIVDVGCSNGEILRQLARVVKDSGRNAKFVGVDANQGFVEKAKAETPKFNKEFPEGEAPDIAFQRADAIKMPFKPGSVAVFNCGNILHEVYSHALKGAYTDEPVAIALGNMRRQLEEGGRIIVREAAKPENPEEIMQLEFNNTNIFREASSQEAALSQLVASGNAESIQTALYDIPPKDLSDYGRFLRFSLEYVHLRDPQEREKLLQHIGKGKYNLQAWLIAEYARKRTFKEAWNEEMNEQNAAFTASHLAEIADRAGLQSDLQAVSENPYYAAITPDMGIVIRNGQGQPVDFATRFPSHIYGILTKVGAGSK